MPFKPVIGVVLVTLAVIIFVLSAVSKVFDTDSEARYAGVSKPAEVSSGKMSEAPAVTPEVVVETNDERLAVENETVSEVVDETLATAEEAVEQLVQESTDSIEEVVTTVEETATEVTEEVVETVTNSAPQVHIVTAEGLKYSPMVITIQPGDTVAWENMSSHDTQSMEGLIPEGAENWHSSMGENYQRTFTVEGIYIYKCTPHFGAGMGGAIIVGNPVNLDAIKNSGATGAAKRLVKKAVKAAEAM